MMDKFENDSIGMPVYDREKTKQLEQLTLTADTVFFFSGTEDFQFWEQGIHSKDTQKKIFVILGCGCRSCGAACFAKRITKEETEKLIRLCHMYEFTDNFVMVTDTNPSVPNIFNYVKTGLLTIQEAWQALCS